MKLDIVGRCGAYPAAGEGTSCYLLSDKETKIVLDMGCSSLSRLLRLAALPEISAVVLSHLHGDHIADATAFKYMCEIALKRGIIKNPVPVFLPESPSAEFSVLTSDAFDLKVIKAGGCAVIGGIKLSFAPMTHPYECYAVRAECGGRVLVYTSDTTYNTELEKVVSGAHVILGDAMLTAADYFSGAPHLSVEELAALAAKAKAKLILTHIPAGGKERVLTAAKKIYADCIIAEEGANQDI